MPVCKTPFFLNPQKALSVDKVDLDKHSVPCPLQMMCEKFDGVWGAFIIQNNKVLHAHTRTPTIVTAVNAIADDISRIAPMLPAEKDKVYAIVGEFWKPNTPFKEISGAIRRRSAQAQGMLFMMHDLVEIKMDGATQDDKPYAKRYTELASAYSLCENCFIINNIKIVKQIAIGTSETDRYAQEAWALGKEGIICRDPKAGYEYGSRNSSMFKVKESLDFDLEVIGVIEGKGKFEGMVGGLICRDSTGRNFSVGGGSLTEQDRQDLWDNLTQFNGPIGVAEVKCMRVQPDGDMREPRFFRWSDKTVNDIQEVK